MPPAKPPLRLKPKQPAFQPLLSCPPSRSASRSGTRSADHMPRGGGRSSTARVWIKPGKGEILVNDKKVVQYFARPVLRMLLTQPFLVADRYNQFDVFCTVSGGGLSGQAGAVRHGISRALTYYEPDLRSILKIAGFLTRDLRAVERKKYGKAKARRSFQFSKR